MGTAGWNQVPEYKWEEAAGWNLLFVNARSVELQEKHYRTLGLLFLDTNIQDISAARLKRNKRKKLGEQKRNNPPLKTVLFSKTFEKKKFQEICLEICC